MKKDITQRCNQKCRDRARDKNKPRRAKRQQAQEHINNMSLCIVESKLDSLLDGHLQLMQAPSFPAIHVRTYAIDVHYLLCKELLIYSMMRPLLKVFLAFPMIYWIHHGIWTPSRTDNLSISLKAL